MSHAAGQFYMNLDDIRKVLLIEADKMSLYNWLYYRTTCNNFGDGAGAALFLEPKPKV